MKFFRTNFQNRGLILIGIVVILVVISVIVSVFFNQKQTLEIPEITENSAGEAVKTEKEMADFPIKKELPKEIDLLFQEDSLSGVIKTSAYPSIINRLVGWGHHTSPTPRLINTLIIHSSYNAPGEDPHDVNGVIELFQLYSVSPHYLIGRNGVIYRLVQDKDIAYQAGIGRMPDGRTNINDFSIGITSIYTKTESPTEIQYQSLAKLVIYLQQKYNILSSNILGHKDISPGRKTDPWNFDWEKFNQLIK